jgi:hypothetical protein
MIKCTSYILFYNMDDIMFYFNSPDAQLNRGPE